MKSPTLALALIALASPALALPCGPMGCPNWQAERNYDDCMDALAQGGPTSQHHLDGWSYCMDRRDQEIETERRLRELEE